MASRYRSLGSALLDPGAPVTGAKTVTHNGVENGASGPNASGYKMVRASALDAAAELGEGCPLLKHGRQITVFETFDAT